MPRPLFSVLIPAYNCESTLLAAVASALADDSVPVEVVIVDDASTDSTPAIVDDLARRDGRVRVSHAPVNRGDGPTRNAALEQVGGEWLVLLDSDDLLLPGSLKAVAERIARPGKLPDAFITRYFERDTLSNATWRLDECFADELAGCGPIEASELADSLFSTVRSVIANKIWNIGFLRANNLVFQDIPRVGDAYFTLGTLAQADTVEFLDVELYEYRRNHGISLTSTGDRHPLSFAQAAEGLYDLLDERGLLDVWRTGYLNWLNENTFYNLVSMGSLAGFETLLERLQKVTFPKVGFCDLTRERAIAKSFFDTNRALASQSTEEALFTCMRRIFASEEDQFFRAEFHLFDARNSRDEAERTERKLRDELARANASLSMKVGLAATLVPRMAKAALAARGGGAPAANVYSAVPKPPISVIVPVSGACPELWDCIESIRAQTISLFELILVDDGTAGGASGVCDEYAAKEPRITVIRQNGGCVAGALEAGIAFARGEWLAFVGANDHVHPGYLSALLGAAIGSGCGLSACGIQDFSGSVPVPPAPLHEGTVVKAGDAGASLAAFLMGKMVEKALLGGIGTEGGVRGCDGSLQRALISSCGGVAESGAVLYARRER